MFNLELAENGVPADVNFVPLGLDAAQGAFAHFAQVTERRRVADQRVDFVARGRSDFDGGVNQLEFLDNDAFDFQEIVFLRRPELFIAGDGDEVVKLFPDDIQILSQMT